MNILMPVLTIISQKAKRLSELEGSFLCGSHGKERGMSMEATVRNRYTNLDPQKPLVEAKEQWQEIAHRDEHHAWRTQVQDS